MNWRDRQFTMSWDDAVRIDWGTIILFGSGIISVRCWADTGLAEAIGTILNILAIPLMIEIVGVA